MVDCDCEVCRSSDPRDNRTRSSILVEEGDVRILVDTSTDFRFQALRAGIDRLDAVLMTHAHADHLYGLDDTRTLSWDAPLPVYGNSDTMREIEMRFDYVFKKTQKGGGKPNLQLYPLSGEPVSVSGIKVLPVPVKHGNLDIYGYRFENFAYLTDCSSIPEESYSLLEGVTRVVIGALRYRPHATHFNFAEAIEALERIGPERAWFTHLCHNAGHSSLSLELKNRRNPRIQPAYDGLVIAV